MNICLGRGRGKSLQVKMPLNILAGMVRYQVTFKDILDCLLCNYTFSLTLGETVCGGGIHIRVQNDSCEFGHLLPGKYPRPVHCSGVPGGEGAPAAHTPSRQSSIWFRSRFGSVALSGSGAFLTPGSGIGLFRTRISDPGSQSHIFDSLVTVF